jgi:type VI secretion system secreted protein VgrG
MSDAAPYSFWAFPFPPGYHRVHRWRGREALSRPYAFDITVSSDGVVDEALELLTLGQRSVFVMRVGKAMRIVTGVIARLRAEGRRGEEQTRLQHTMRLVPSLWLLRRKKGSRVFQDMRVPDVVDRVLEENGLARRWELTRHHPVRPYVTQYEESDLAFVERLLAEAGIFYSFVQPADLAVGLAGLGVAAAPDMATWTAAAASVAMPSETLLLCDDASGYLPLMPAALACAAVGGLMGDRFDKVKSFSPVRSVRPTVAEFRDYDPDRPEVWMGGRANPQPSPSLAAAAQALAGLVAPAGPLETYEHHYPFLFPDWHDAAEEAGKVLRQKRRRADWASGASTCATLAPGLRFHLEDHELAPFNQEYAVVGVEHAGVVGSEEELYDNRFTCVPAAVTYCPRRRRRRRVQVALTALVVGTGGDAIHVDPVGRIKVKFHWDRTPGREETSCWIRTMHPWSGAGWGHQFIPRVGTEVVVVFEGGDPDRPIVVGSVFNGTHPPPFSLPSQKTRSGIRTSTVPGGAGFNELSFEDAQGREQIFLHAEGDLVEVVRRGRSLTVGSDDHVKLGGSRHDRVDQDSVEAVGRNKTLEVAGDLRAQIAGARVEAIARSSDTRVEESLSLRVGGSERIDVKGGAEQRYASDLTLRVEGCHTVIVGKHDRKQSLTTRAEGSISLSCSDGLELSSESGITLRCGTTSLRIGADGIELVGAAVRATGDGAGVAVSSDGIKLRAKKRTELVSDEVVIKTKDASLSLASEVKIDGQRILLNSPDDAKEEPPPPPTPPTQIELKDQKGQPLRRQPFVVERGDGQLQSGVTDDEGKCELVLEKGGTIRFPGAQDGQI